MLPQDDFLRRMVKMLCSKDPQFADIIKKLSEAFKKKDFKLLKEIERELVRNNNKCWDEIMKALARTNDQVIERDLVQMSNEITQMRNRVVSFLHDVEVKGFDDAEGKGLINGA
jgi:hypothetical protein